MPTLEITAEARSTADPDTLYGLLADGSTWPTWSPLGSFELESAGTGTGEGVGAVRVFHTGMIRSRERLLELVPGRRLGYEMVSGLPVRGYRAEVDLLPDPAGQGTVVRWHSSFSPAVPGTGWFFRTVLGRVIQQCASGLAAYAGRQHTAPGT